MRWTGQANVNSAEFAGALPNMSDAQLQFYVKALKVYAPDAHKLVLEECARRVVLAVAAERR
jgi:hypothetical protein